MKIITPEEFDVEEKDNLLYVGRIRAASYLWVHEQGSYEGLNEHNLSKLERIASHVLHGDILVHQTVDNVDDWVWAGNILSGKVGLDDTVSVAAAELYRDPKIHREAHYIGKDILAQIEPQLESLGYLEGSTFGNTDSALLNKATNIGADYVVVDDEVLANIHVGRITTGTTYRIKNTSTSGNSLVQPQILVPEQSTHNPLALDYFRRLMDGKAKGTAMDWNKK